MHSCCYRWSIFITVLFKSMKWLVSFTLIPKGIILTFATKKTSPNLKLPVPGRSYSVLKEADGDVIDSNLQSRILTDHLHYSQRAKEYTLRWHKTIFPPLLRARSLAYVINWSPLPLQLDGYGSSKHGPCILMAAVKNTLRRALYLTNVWPEPKSSAAGVRVSQVTERIIY